MKTVAILQPSYIPWRGYFHLIQRSDVFVWYDCVQYDKHGWRNRNLIKTLQGRQWLTIPVSAKGNVNGGRLIKDIPILWNSHWAEKHRRSIHQAYAKSPYYKHCGDLLAAIFERKDELLADFTCSTTELIARRLGIQHTSFVRSSALNVQGSKTDRLLAILGKLGATHYISGPSAASYIEAHKFAQAGITLEYMQYTYPEYPQGDGHFEPFVTVLDLLFYTGNDAYKYIWT